MRCSCVPNQPHLQVRKPADSDSSTSGSNIGVDLAAYRLIVSALAGAGGKGIER